LHARVSGVSHRGIVGYSLGGLITFYEAMYHPDVFDLYGALSPALYVGLDNTMSRWQFPQLPSDNRIFVGTTDPGDTYLATATNIVTGVAQAYGSLIPGVNYFREDLYPGEHSISSAVSFAVPCLRTLLKNAYYV
jgi:predicted alpha/beta superfamily hydrolase